MPVAVPGRSRSRRHWIDAPTVPGIAAQQPPRSEHEPTQRTMPAQRLDCVRRARRIKPASWAEQGGHEQLVAAHQRHQTCTGVSPHHSDHPTQDTDKRPPRRVVLPAACRGLLLRHRHFPLGARPVGARPASAGRPARANASSRPRASSSVVACAEAGKARMTRRVPEGRLPSRGAVTCCNRRRTRLRTTAPPTERATANAA